MTLIAGAPAGEQPIASWRSAGPRRIVVVADWCVRDAAGRPVGRVSVQGAAELSVDGQTCQARVQWRHVDLSGLPHGGALTGEADGERL